MNVWWSPIDRLQTVKCEVCGRAFAHRSDLVPIERVCRSCLNSAPEKRAA
jgi:formylmethanofuran dehydrogenase subunit E